MTQNFNFFMGKITILFLFVLFKTPLFGQRNYTAGEIQSKAEVTYGRFEFMMYSSDVSGTTSTFFLWKNGGNEANSRWNELDIETFGKSATEWQSNPIWEYFNADQDTKRWEEVHANLAISNNWVKFTLEWTPNYIAWYNNDIEVRRILKGENVPATHFRYNNGNSDDPVGYIADPMRMCFNHWATFPGEWLGPWNENDLPSYQFVDWFTYQKWNGTGFDTVSIRYDYNSITELTANYNISTHTFTENQCQFSTKSVGIVNGYLWLGIFKNGTEAAPSGNQIPNSSINPVVYNHILPKKIEAEEFNTQVGLQTETVVASEGIGLNIGYTDLNDYVEYSIEVINTGNYTVDFRVASLNGNAGFSVSVDGVTQINEIEVASTGGWQNWITQTNTLNLSSGKHTLRLTVTKAGFNINWIDFKTIVELPVLNFTNLTNSQKLIYGYDLNINVNAIHSLGIANVQLYVDGIFLRQENLAPYDWGLGANDAVLNSLSSGLHIFKAVARSISGEVAEKSIKIIILHTQTISLQKGWNLISTYVQPEDNTIETLFSGLDVAMIKDANSFWKAFQPSAFNSLKTMSAGNGYLVYMNAEATLSISGTPLEMPYLGVSKNGWSLIGCPYQTSSEISSHFDATNCQTVKNFEGFWIPNANLNSIQSIDPGKAYFIKK